MVAEPQLVDYLKKAKESGQSDDQSKAALYKNGWTEAEVAEALMFLGQSQQPQAQPQAQIIVQPKMETEPLVVNQPKTEVVAKPKTEAKPQMQAKPAQPVQTMQSNMPRIKKSRLFLLLMVLLLVVSCGVGYFQYSNLIWNLFRPNPETVMSKMLANMENVKSLHTLVQADIVATDKNTPVGKLSINLNGSKDMADVNNPKANFNFSMNFTPSGATSPSASGVINVLVVDKALYFNFSNIVAPSTNLYSGLDISQIKGNWFKFDQNSITALNIPLTNNQTLVKKIQDIALAENMFSVDKQLNDEIINGQNTYHYSVIISKDKLQDLLNKIMAASEATTAAGSNTALAQNMAQAFVKTFVDAIGDINLEMWIGKHDYMLYQSKLDKAIDLSKISAAISTQLEIKLNTVNSDFNKPVTVQAPANFQKIEDVISPLIKSQKIASDMQQISFLARSGSNYSSLCTHGLLNGYQPAYGSNLITLNNDILSQGGGKPACFSSSQNYCVSTQLADGSYLCTSKTGFSGKVKCVSPTTVCK